MAVVISSQFYQASLWKNISKIVFTSPNMDSPAIAGTRSHILPGEGDLATWYEDTANMYRIEDNQWETNSDFFNYRMKSKDTIEILDHSGYIDVKETNYSSLDTFIKENSGVEVIGYADNTSYITYTKPRLEYTLTQLNLDEIYNDTITRVREVVERREAVEANPGSTTQTRAYYTLTFNRTVGSLTKVVSGVDFKVVFAFSEQSLVHDISISSIQTTQELKEIPIETLFNNPIPAGTITHPPDRSIFFGEYSIQGSNDLSIWITLHEGANTTNLVCNISLPEIVYYKYIRLSVTSNIGLDGTIFNTDFYGLSKIAFNVSVPEPIIHSPILTVSSDIDISASAGSNSISITNSGDGDMVWSAEVTLGSSWLNITSGGAGTNSGVVSFNFISNVLSSVRTATISVTAIGASGSPVDVYITQAAGEVADTLTEVLNVYEVISSTGSNSGSGSICNIYNNASGIMPWTIAVTEGATWFSVSPTSGSNSGSIIGSWSANIGISRSARYVVTALNAHYSPISIVFDQTSVQPILALSTQTVSIGSGASVGNLSTVTNTGTGTMAWTAAVTTGGTWYSITSGSSGSNTGTIAGSCTANTGAQRVATVRVTATGAIGSPKDITITQAELAVDTSSWWSVTPSSTINISSTSNANFVISNDRTGVMNHTSSVLTGGIWISAPTYSWPEIPFTGGGTVMFTCVNNNTGVSRTGTVRISVNWDGITGTGYRDLTIVQAAAAVVDTSTDWSVTPSSNLTIDGSSTDADFLITNNIASIMSHTASVISGAWISAPDPVIWVNDGYVMFDCNTNTTGVSRVGTVRISVSWQNGNVSHKDLTITQEGSTFSTSIANIDTNTIEQLDSETNSSTLYGYSIVVTQLVTEVEGAGSCSIIYLPYNVVLSNWTVVVTTGATWFSVAPNNGDYRGGTIVGTYLLNKGPERSAVITVTMPGAANSPAIFTIKQKVGIPGPLFFTTSPITYNGVFVNTSTIASFATDRIKEIVDTKTLTGTVYNIPRTLLYYVYTLDRNKGWYTPVNVDVPPYIIFTFPDATKITAMYMSSVQVNQEVWQIPLATLFNIPTPTATTTLTPKTYFIGNFNIQGSNDQITWTTIYTGANTTKPTKTAYFANTQYYKYYKLNILNNTGLSTTAGTPPVVNTIFDTDYYGIRGLKFYVNDFSTEAGSSFIALYEFSDFSNPKIMKVSNAAMIPSTTPEENTTTTNHSVKGLLTETRVSGGVTLVSGVYQTVFYSSYAVNIKSSTDPYDYLTTATCISPTDGGTGTSTNSQTYTKQDKINTIVSSIVERGNKGQTDEYLLFRSTGTTTVPINTADWTGLVDITYATSTSGTVISGVLATNIAGITERKYESSLYSRRDSFRLTISDYVTTSGVIAEDTDLYIWGFTNRLLDLDCQNSIVFEITNGEAYNCRLTAWDDVTHSTTKNELIQGDHVRCSAMAYCCGGSKLVPTESKSPLNLVYPPVHNRIFKGNTIDGTNKLFYGDFDMVYRYQSTVYGDYLIFKPLLYGIDENISYGIHDYLITFHYSYT